MTAIRRSALVAFLLSVSALLSAAERINQAGRILGPVPTVSTPTQFNNTQGDAIISAMQIYPRENAWYDNVSSRPKLSTSDTMIANIKSNLPSNHQGLFVFTEMNYVFVPDNQAKIDVHYIDYPDESDDIKPGTTDIGSLPWPSNVPIEAWPAGTGSLTLDQVQRDVNGNGGDRHAIVVMPGTGFVWETWQTYLTTRTPAWEASNCAKFNLNSNALRPDGWTSGDAAGLSMFPALIRYDECERGEIEHAMRLVVGKSRGAHLYPATHHAGSTAGAPAMGERVRLKSAFVVPAGWTKQEKAVCAAFKKYGALVADNGNFFSISCCPDQRFPANCFNNLQSIDINNFEVVQGYGATEGPRSAGAPTANAGADLAGTVAGGATLNGQVTGTGVTISWYAYPGVTQPGTVGFGSPGSAVTTSTFSTAGTYTLMLKADDGVHTPAFDAVIVTVTSGPPDTTAPTCSITTPVSTATYATANSPLNISGTASDNVGVTQVTWSNDRGGNGTATGTTSWSVSGIALSSGQNVLSVTARDAAGNTNVATLTVTYSPPPPSAPSNLSATATSTSQINLTWTDNSNNETGFKLERKTGSAGTYAQIATPAANAVSASDAGLSASTQYFYRIRATNSAGDSAYSNEVSATTQSPPPPPAAPSSLAATATSTSQINLTWSDNANSETGFKLERKTGSGGTYAQIATPAADAVSFSNTGLSAGTQYFYRIRATNSAGDSAYSNEVSATTQTPPPIPNSPTNLQATAASTTQINLTWIDTATNETGYLVERKTGSAGTYAQIASRPANSVSYSDASCAPSTQYFYRVRATNAGGNSAYSNEANATTFTPPQVPTAPSNLLAAGVSISRIALLWLDNASNETGYEIERSSDGATFALLGTVGADSTSYNDDNLPPATAYYYRVRAINASVASAYSNNAFAVTVSGGEGGGGGSTPPPGQGPNDDFDGDGMVNAIDTDDDNDGVPDVEEIAAGTNPYDFFSGTPTAMTVRKLSGSMKFNFTGKDSCSISGVLPGLPPGMVVTGKTQMLNIGGAAVAFVLDVKGKGRNLNGSIALRLKPSKRNKITKQLDFLGGDVAFIAKITRGTWSDDWSDEGINPGADATKQPIALTVALDLGGKSYVATVNALYSGKAGKSGRMKN